LQTGEGATPDQAITILVEAWDAISAEDAKTAWQLEQTELGNIGERMRGIPAQGSKEI
jgi:hypothetical protein